MQVKAARILSKRKEDKTEQLSAELSQVRQQSHKSLTSTSPVNGVEALTSPSAAVADLQMQVQELERQV